MVRPKGVNLKASPEQVMRIREMHGKRVSDEHLLWLRARGRRAPNSGLYSYPVIGEIEGLAPTIVRDIVLHLNAYQEPEPTLGYFDRIRRWVDRGDTVPRTVEPVE